MGTDFTTILASAKRPQRTVPICLRGDLTARFEELERQLTEAERGADTDSIETGSSALAIAQQIAFLREEMKESTYTFVVEALPRPAYQRLKELHPPRQEENGEVRREDAYLDANYDTFLTPLLRACLVDPVLDDTEWARTEEQLTDAQYNSLVNAAVYVNRGGVDIPFSHAASTLLKSSGNE